MAEVKTPGRVFVLDYICDEEGCEGIVVKDSGKPMLYLSDPPKIPHICSECKAEYLFTDKTYPALAHERVTEETE
tara:strand:- start:961 stop:1185 length:225 start_codon:yes stop_codon:yes gene_type:complete